MADSAARHWNAVYRIHAYNELSWFQAEPVTSLRLLSLVLPAHRSMIDVGAGTATLADALLDAGWSDLTVLDSSARALDTVRQRLGVRSAMVSFVVADVRAWTPRRTYASWHDRAVFHFLVDAGDRDRYVATAARAVPPGGTLVIATFAPDGPDHCSGLPTARYDAEGLAAQFHPAFALAHQEREEHVTPGGVVQPFTWTVLRRR